MVENNDLTKIDTYIKETLVSLLYQTIPNSKRLLEEQTPDGGIYLFMNDFAIALSEKLITDTSSDYVKKSFDYINSLGESNNLEILNIVKIGILEILYTTNGLDRLLVENLLTEKLKYMFREFSTCYQ